MRGLIYICAEMTVLLAACAQAPNTKANNLADAETSQMTEIVVTVPAGTPTVYLTGNLDALGPWQADALALSGEGLERNAHLSIPEGHTFEYKFTLGAWANEAVDSQQRTLPNFVRPGEATGAITHEISDFKHIPDYLTDVEGANLQGNLTYWFDMSSEFLSETRHVSIWTPPGYDPESDKTYRVIYMSDGQNLFDPRLANTGIDWGVDEAMMQVVQDTGTEPAIVVSTWSTARRAYEYSPWHDSGNYADFLLDELMPQVEANFAVAKGRENTFHMGSSMGGLLSFYMVMNHPDVFSACGCISSHFSFSPQMFARWIEQRPDAQEDATPYIIRDIEAGLMPASNVRFWFDYGTLGLDADYAMPHQRVREWLDTHGRIEGQDFVMREYEGADHNEAAWRARLTDPLSFLLAPNAGAH